jgi:hypothetical protein
MIDLQDKQRDENSYYYQSQKDSSIKNELLPQQQKHQQPRRPELRKVQALQGERSLVFVLPKSIAVELGIEKGDYLSVHMELPRKIILEKAEV